MKTSAERAARLVAAVVASGTHSAMDSGKLWDAAVAALDEHAREAVEAEREACAASADAAADIFDADFRQHTRDGLDGHASEARNMRDEFRDFAAEIRARGERGT